MNWVRGKTYSFVVHEHLAKRAGKHYDLRILREDGNVESFATKKEILNLKPLQKILLFRQPLHDKYWLNFEGDIESGYGAGTLKIVDKGSVQILKTDSKATVFWFKGKRLKGVYVLVKIKDNQFLFFKTKKQPKDYK